MQRQKTALVCLVVVTLCAGVHTQSNGPHELRCIPGNAHIGSYDYGAKPVLRIHSGETVRVETCSDAVEDPLVKPSEIPPNWKQTVDSIKDRGPGVHLLTGPIAVEGAQPGDVLEIKFLKFEFVVPFAVAAIAPNFTALPDDFPYERMRVVRLNREARTAEFLPGITLKLSPFFGSVGVAPPAFVDRVSSNPPGLHGGNPGTDGRFDAVLTRSRPGRTAIRWRRPRGSRGWGSELLRTGNGAGRHHADYRAKGCTATLAARGDPDSLHYDGTEPGLEQSRRNRHAGDGVVPCERETSLSRRCAHALLGGRGTSRDSAGRRNEGRSRDVTKVYFPMTRSAVLCCVVAVIGSRRAPCEQRREGAQ